MQAALPLYENRPIFLDHADEQNSPTRRKLRDFAGQVLSPRYEGERLRGDLRLLGPHADWLFDLIEAAPHDIGMSHVVLGRRSSQGQLVEQIERVVSVDIVAFPATTQSFQEGTVTDWMTELVEQSSLPMTLHRTAQEALATHPEPERLLELLEQWATLLQKESPQSVMRAVATESNASQAFGDASDSRIVVITLRRDDSGGVSTSLTSRLGRHSKIEHGSTRVANPSPPTPLPGRERGAGWTLIIAVITTERDDH